MFLLPLEVVAVDQETRDGKGDDDQDGDGHEGERDGHADDPAISMARRITRVTAL